MAERDRENTQKHGQPRKGYGRGDRLATETQKALSGLLLGAGKGLLTVTKVEVSPDLRHINALISTLGDDAQLNAAVALLKADAWRYRKALAQEMKLRYTPQLHFEADHALREADHVLALIQQSNPPKVDDAGEEA
jgi:ribosome-binding factor A